MHFWHIADAHASLLNDSITKYIQIKDKNHMITSTDIKKAFDEI